MSQQSFSLLGWFRTPLGLCLAVSAVLAAAYLGIAHTMHVVSAVPYLLFLLCPAMHLLMHSSHSQRQPHQEGEKIASELSSDSASHHHH